MLRRLSLLLPILFLAVACTSVQIPASFPITPSPTATAVPTELTPTPTATAVPTELTPTVDPAHRLHLPDPVLTPGDTLEVTAADICVPGYSSKVRSVTDAVKKQVYLEYGITSRQPYEYEVDHLISLQLGGSNSIINLWPEPYAGDWNARVKDKLENKLHRLVCDGGLDLKTAQQEIATDWVAAYLKYIGQP